MVNSIKDFEDLKELIDKGYSHFEGMLQKGRLDKDIDSIKKQFGLYFTLYGGAKEINNIDSKNDGLHNAEMLSAIRARCSCHFKMYATFIFINDALKIVFPCIVKNMLFKNIRNSLAHNKIEESNSDIKFLDGKKTDHELTYIQLSDLCNFIQKLCFKVFEKLEGIRI